MGARIFSTCSFIPTVQYLVMDRHAGDISRYFEGYKSRGARRRDAAAVVIIITAIRRT